MGPGQEENKADVSELQDVMWMSSCGVRGRVKRKSGSAFDETSPLSIRCVSVCVCVSLLTTLVIDNTSMYAGCQDEYKMKVMQSKVCSAARYTCTGMYLSVSAL